MAVERNIADKLIAGDLLGIHIGSQTTSDIAVIVIDPTKQGRMISYFDDLTDAIFDSYLNRGVSTRAEVSIPKLTRDANPISCNGDTFITTDTLENWVVLK